MKCEIRSWGEVEKECGHSPEGECSECGAAWNYISLSGIMSDPMVKDYSVSRDGMDLKIAVSFTDDDKVYTGRISKGSFSELMPA